MPIVALIRPLHEGDESEFQEPLGIERLAGFLKANIDGEVRLFDRRLYKEERLFGLTDKSSVSSGTTSHALSLRLPHLTSLA